MPRYMDTELFKKKAILKHNDYYDYTMSIFVRSDEKLIYHCPVHGEVSQTPNAHLAGKGCKECKHRSYPYTSEEIIEKFSDTHGDLYDYSEVHYVNLETKVKVICKNCNESFMIFPQNHCRGWGCTNCYSKRSSGENTIKKLLSDYNFLHEHSFPDCIYKKKLRFDFYLPEYNICIEFDGKQHFQAFEWFGGEERFIELQLKDSIKNQYCLDNNIKLFRIKYNDDIEFKINEIKRYINDEF